MSSFLSVQLEGQSVRLQSGAAVRRSIKAWISLACPVKSLTVLTSSDSLNKLTVTYLTQLNYKTLVPASCWGAMLEWHVVGLYTLHTPETLKQECISKDAFFQSFWKHITSIASGSEAGKSRLIFQFSSSFFSFRTLVSVHSICS